MEAQEAGGLQVKTLYLFVLIISLRHMERDSQLGM